MMFNSSYFHCSCELVSTCVPRLLIWAVTSENVPSDECPAKLQISLRICAGWSESSLGDFWIATDATFLHADNKVSSCGHSCGCTCWSESTLGAHVRWYVFSHWGSFVFFRLRIYWTYRKSLLVILPGRRRDLTFSVVSDRTRPLPKCYCDMIKIKGPVRLDTVCHYKGETILRRWFGFPALWRYLPKPFISSLMSMRAKHLLSVLFFDFFFVTLERMVNILYQ